VNGTPRSSTPQRAGAPTLSHTIGWTRRLGRVVAPAVKRLEERRLIGRGYLQRLGGRSSEGDAATSQFDALSR
jgi:hypothetical protein